MGEPDNHPSQLLQDAIDGRLDPSQRAVLDAHLATCERCRREMTALRWTKAHLAVVAADTDADLVPRLQRALDEEDGHRADAREPPAQRITRPTLAYWLAAAAAVIVLVWLASRFEVRTAPAQAAADFRAVSSGEALIEVRTTDPATLEAHLRTARLSFATRVFDFGMMNYALTGGGVHRFQGRESALFAYRRSDGRAVVCQMYKGTLTELPPPVERRRQNDIDFLIYGEGNLTVVFWQEGGVLCVLVAEGDAESAIRLAFAKAVKV